MQQEYNSFALLLVNALNRIFKSNLSLNNFKWLLTKLELSYRAFEILYTPFPILNQELQNHDPVGRHIPVLVMYGSTPPAGPGTSPRPTELNIGNLEPDLLAGEGGWVANHLIVGQSEVNGTMRASVSNYILSLHTIN